MHPVQLSVERAEPRSRLTTFFRGILAIPHYIVAALWGIAAYVAVIIAWFAILFTGRMPRGLFDFITGWLSYAIRVTGYYWLVSDPFPPFNGSAGYPLTATVEYPDRLSRLTTFFRPLMLIPAYIILAFLNVAGEVCAFVAWLIIIVTGHCPEGLANFLELWQRYNLRVLAYACLVTDRYPSFEAPSGQTAPTPQAASAAW